MKKVVWLSLSFLFVIAMILTPCAISSTTTTSVRPETLVPQGPQMDVEAGDLLACLPEMGVEAGDLLALLPEIGVDAGTL